MLVATPAASTGTIVNDNHLTWTAPEGGGGGSTHPPVWIHWDSGENSDGIGTGGAADFDIAARFDVSQIEEFDGMAVTKVAFFPNEAACEYSIRVWQGDMAATLLVDQVVSSPTIGAWNEVELETPVAIDVTQELWFGVRCNTAAGYPAGCDAGPQVSRLRAVDLLQRRMAEPGKIRTAHSPSTGTYRHTLNQWMIHRLN